MFGNIEDDIAKFIVEIETWVDTEEIACSKVYQGLCISCFNSTLFNTPQWTGNAAANWNLSSGEPNFTVNTFPDYFNIGGTPFSKLMPNQEAFDLAAIRNESEGLAVSLKNPSVFICNASTDLNDEVYVSKLEENPSSYLRPENDPGAMIELTTTWFNSLGDIDSEQATELASAELGVRR